MAAIAAVEALGLNFGVLPPDRARSSELCELASLVRGVPNRRGSTRRLNTAAQHLVEVLVRETYPSLQSRRRPTGFNRSRTGLPEPSNGGAQRHSDWYPSREGVGVYCQNSASFPNSLLVCFPVHETGNHMNR